MPPLPPPTWNDRVVHYAKQSIGLSYRNNADQFAAWLFGKEAETDPVWSKQAAGSVWTCGLHARAVLRAAGEKDQRISGNYKPRIGLVISDLTNLARERKSWRQSERPTDIGDIVIVSNPDHVYVVTHVAGDEVYTSEGVGSPGGNEEIAAGHMTLHKQGGKWFSKSHRPDGLDREVYGTIKAGLLNAYDAPPGSTGIGAAVLFAGVAALVYMWDKLPMAKLQAVRGPDEPTDEEVIPTHPLFAHVPRNKPLKFPIGAIDVRRMKKGKSRFIEWVPAEDLADEQALQERFGAGDYELIARNQERTEILTRCFLSIGEDSGDSGPDDQDEPGAPRVARPEPMVEILRELNAAREREVSAARERESQMIGMVFSAMASTQQASMQMQATVLQAVSQLSSARIADQRELVTAMATNQQAQVQPASFIEQLQDAFMTGMATGEERGAGGGSNDTATIGSIVSAVMQGASMQQNVPPPGFAPPAGSVPPA